MDKKQDALDAFSKKFNCAQSVFSAFARDVGIDRETALKVSACFGGGMRCGEVCGAVTGALMAIGMKYGSSTENDSDNKQLTSTKALEFINKFKEKNGTALCRELLKFDISSPDEMKEIKQKGLFATVCPKAIESAVEILEEVFKE